MAKIGKRLLGTPVIKLTSSSDLIDTYSLCGSKHEAWVYVTDEDDDGIPNATKDSIIVAFTGTDSSGAGCIDQIFGALLAAIGGSITFVSDPEEWQSTVDEAYDIVWDNAHNCGGKADCLSKYGQAGLYSTIYGVTTGGKWVLQTSGNAAIDTGSWIGKQASKLKFWSEDEADYIRNQVRRSDSFASEITTCNPTNWGGGEDNPDGSFLGTVYHNQSGGDHKVKITINKLYQGKTTTVYQSELAGGTEYKQEGNKLFFEPAFRKFKLNGPGTYTINVESLAANMDCGNPKMSITTSVNVAENPDTDSTTPELSAFTDVVSDITEATGLRPLYVYGGAVALGGLLVAKYLQRLSGSGDDDESE